MTIKEIAPFISCYCMEEELEEAKKTYQEIYVITPAGIFKHAKLRFDRYIQIKVDTIPGQKTELKEQMEFLPNGEKIPYEFFTQIVAFFKEVIKVKKSNVEAHIHVLWNPDLGYYLAVPNQTVSGAAVKYDYNHIGANDVIVADFHSHNSMGKQK